MKVLALDIATQTGIAIGDVGGAPKCYSVDLGKKDSHDVRFSRLLRMVDRLIREEKPDYIAVEAPIGGPQASAFLIGLVAIVRAVSAARGVPCEDLHIGSVRKHFLGKVPTTRGMAAKDKRAAVAAIKGLIVARCRSLGWNVPDHDSADAAACFDFACSSLSPAHGAMTSPLFGGSNG